MAATPTGAESGRNVSGSGTGWNPEAAFRQRLASSGAKTGDIQVSLMWDSHDDIDLHVTHRFGSHVDTIFWRNRMSRTGGLLDVDMNAQSPLQPHAIENIFWPFGNAPRGEFVVGVHFFRSWTGRRQVPVTIRIKSADGVDHHHVTVQLGAPVTTVAVFRNGDFRSVRLAPMRDASEDWRRFDAGAIPTKESTPHLDAFLMALPLHHRDPFDRLLGWQFDADAGEQLDQHPGIVGSRRVGLAG